MSRSALLPILLSAFAFGCGGAPHAPTPPRTAVPRPGAVPSSAPTPTPDGPPELAQPLGTRGSPIRLPVELSAAAVEGFPPLPSYRVTVRNVSGRPVRNVVATAVYLDGDGRAMKGENQDVQFGSPLKPIEPGATLETVFLSRVDRAPSVRLVLRSVTFLEDETGPKETLREWTNPRHGIELSELAARP